MTREEAARVLEALYGNWDPIEEINWQVLRKAVEVLREQGWVKTSERFPEGECELLLLAVRAAGMQRMGDVPGREDNNDRD